MDRCWRRVYACLQEMRRLRCNGAGDEVGGFFIICASIGETFLLGDDCARQLVRP